MKQNANKIIKAVALATAVCAVLCACDRTKQNGEPSSTATTASQTTQSATQESTSTEPVTQPSTTEPATVPTTESTTAPKPSTTSPKPTQPTTQEDTETTETNPETTTRHENPVINAFINAGKIAGYSLISKDEIKTIAEEMADDSKIYFVRLEDGTKTYYMAVDLQTAKAMALSNPQVLRELCRQLDSKQQLMAGEQDDYVLMDYTHLVGELEVHYVGYLITGALGADDGPLSSFYNSCKVADLNIDEDRFGPVIDVIGTICG